MSEAGRRPLWDRLSGRLPDWWPIRRLADAVSLKVAAGAPGVVSILTAMAKPYLGLSEASLAGRDFRWAFIAFCACAALWAGVVCMTFIALPRALRDHPSRLAVIAAVKNAAGTSAVSGVVATATRDIDHAAIAFPLVRAMILLLMFFALVSSIAGISSLLRGLGLLPV